MLRAMVIGPLLIVAPIVSSYAALTVALSVISGERLNFTQAAGILTTLAGIILSTVANNKASIKRPEEVEKDEALSTRPFAWMSAGIAYAIGAALLFGIGVWLLSFIVPVLGSTMTVFASRVSGSIFALLFFTVSRTPIRLTSASSLKWLMPMGILDISAAIAFNIGLQTGLTSIVAVLSSMSSVATILLGLIILRERIPRIQAVGIFVTLLGVAVVSA